MMTCHFSVISLSTERLSGESIAVGMVAIDESGGVVASFTNDWSRAATFLDGDVAFAQETAADLLADSLLTVDRLQELSRDCQNAIRFSDPAEVDVCADEWITEFGPLFFA